MRCRLEQFMTGLIIVFLATGSLAAQTSTADSGVGPTLQYLAPMSFGPDAVLFAADAQEVFIYALDLSEHVVGGVAGTKSVPDIDKKLADLLGTTASNIVLTDLAVYPKTGNTFISLMRGSDPVLLRVDGDADITVVPLDQVSYTRVGLPNPPGETTDMLLKGGRGMPIPNYPSNQVAEYPMNLFGVQTITDLAYVDGRLYAAGLSNEEFASKLRSIAYPFTSVDEGTSVEIWHAPHDQFETRSPIYTFVPYEINGEPNLIASYLCTPLVKFPISSLQPGADVRGETIAEFGSGNRPLDMIVYQKNGQDYLLMSNNRHGVMKIPTQDFGDTENLTGIVPDGATAGVPFETIDALQGVEQLDRLDMDHAIALIRSDTDVLRLEVVDLP